jgi:iron complex outermembrane receptor protein
LALRSAYDDRSFSAQNFYTTFASDTATEQVKTWWNQASITYTKNKVKWNTNIGYKSVSDHYLFNHKSLPNDNKSSVVQALSSADISFTEKTGITTGIQFISKGITSNDRGDHSVYQGAAFVILHQAIGTHLFLDPAMRFDYNERGGFEFVPQLNAAFRGDNYQLRGSIGRTIRDADFTERYNNYNKALVTSGRIGNPDLEAETSISYEAGGDFRISDKIKVSGTWFQRHHEKLIDYIVTPYSEMPRKDNLSPTGTYALAKNFSKVKTTGWETDIQFRQPLGSLQQLTANVGLVWLNSKLDDGSSPGFYLSSHAKFLTNFSVIYSYKWLSLSVNGVYKTRQEQQASSIHAEVSKDYFLVNGKADISFAKHFGAFIQLDNIGDTHYSDLLGSPMPGRWLMGGLRAGF